MEKDGSINVALGENLRNTLKAIAAREGKSLRELIIEVLSEAAKKKERQPLRSAS